MRKRVLALPALLAALATFAAASGARAASSGDFALGVNAEGQTCRAVERFDAPKGGTAVDVYCGAWDKASGWIVEAPAATANAVQVRLDRDCPGVARSLTSGDFAELRQIACGGAALGGSTALRRYGLFARRGSVVVAGTAFPADWAPLIAAARVLSGAAPKTAVAASAQTPPGLREIEAVYPQGAPGQGAEFNYELLKRRAFERNVAWSFAGAEEDFETLLRAHDALEPDDAEGRAEILAEIGLNLSNGGRFSEAAETFAQASALAASAGDTLTASKILNYRALDLLNQHRYMAARSLALEANRVRGGSPPNGRGAAITATDARAVDRATSRAGRGLLLNFDASTPAERAAILNAQGFFIAGVASRALGDRAAESYLSQATAELLVGRSPPAWLTAAIADEQAQTHLARGDAAGAAASAEAGLAQVRLVAPQTRPEAHLLLTLASVETAAGETQSALANGRAAMTIFAHQSERPGLPADLAASELSLLLTQWERTPSPDLANEYLETLALTWDGAAARSASELAARLALRGAGGQARAYQDAQRAARAAVAARQRLALDPTTTEAQTRQADVVVADTAKRFAAAEDELRSQAPAYLELLNPSVKASDLSAALADKEGYLRIVMAPKGGFGALVTSSGVHPYAITITGAEADDLVRRIRRTTTFRGRRLPPYDVVSAAKLYAALIGPIAADLAALTRLEVDVSGSLASAPFAALVETVPTGDVAQKIADDGDYSGVAWLARRVAITNALGPASFVRFRKSRSGDAAAAKVLAAYGDFQPDPTLAAERVAQDHGLSQACQGEVAHVLATLGPLPDTADEARQVAATFKGQVRLRLGAAFTDLDFLTNPDIASADVILLATHGVLGMSSCFPEPSLLTSVGPSGEGLIEASRVLDRRLNARLVILSACDTAGGGQLDTARSGLAGGGEALSGLVRGFLYAGVPDVLATEWKVDSATSATEVTAFLAAASKPGATLAESLASAQKALYQSAETGHPFYWAAFILVGDGATAIAPPAPPASPAATKSAAAAATRQGAS